MQIADLWRIIQIQTVRTFLIIIPCWTTKAAEDEDGTKLYGVRTEHLMWIGFFHLGERGWEMHVITSEKWEWWQSHPSPKLLLLIHSRSNQEHFSRSACLKVQITYCKRLQVTSVTNGKHCINCQNTGLISQCLCKPEWHELYAM